MPQTIKSHYDLVKSFMKKMCSIIDILNDKIMCIKHEKEIMHSKYMEKGRISFIKEKS